MSKKIIIIIASVFLTSCCTTRQCKVEKAEQKIYDLTQEFPELQKQIDTIIVSDTIQIETMDRIKIKYIKTDSVVYLTGECEGDTIFITKEVPVEKIIIKEPTFAEKAKDWTYFVFAIAALLLVVRIFFKDVFKVFNIFK